MFLGRFSKIDIKTAKLGINESQSCNRPRSQSNGFSQVTACTTSTFRLFFDEDGLPERGLSSIFSRPSLKVLCHLKIIFLAKVAYQTGFC